MLDDEVDEVDDEVELEGLSVILPFLETDALDNEISDDVLLDITEIEVDEEVELDELDATDKLDVYDELDELENVAQ